MTPAPAAAAQPLEDFQPNQFDLSPGIRLLEASAGTGKTFALAHLVLRLVSEAGHPIRSLLVVTFTDAAAAELRDRIACRLQQALSGLEDRPGWQAPDAVLAEWLRQQPDPELRRRWQGRLLLALEELDGADITTIHGFCRRTLSRQALQAGLPPQLPLETDPELLLTQVVHDYWQHQVLGLPLHLLAGLRRSGLDPDRLRDVVRLADGDASLELEPLPPTLTADRSLAEALPQFWQTWSGRFLELWPRHGRELQAQICAAAQHWRTLGASKTGNYSPKPIKDRCSELQDWLDQHGGEPGYEDVRNQELLTQYFHPGGFSQQARAVEADDREPSLPQPALMRAIAELVDGPHDLLLRHACHWSRRELRLRRQRSGVTSFGQLLETLDPGPDANQPTPLLQAVGERYRVALIDEFQDTDPVQWRILSLALGRGDHLLVMVGDPKQAIYRFRGGDLPTYLAARDRADSRLSLRQNRRSSPALIAALNGLMAGPIAAAGRGLVRSRLEVPVVEAAADLGTRWADPTAAATAAATTAAVTTTAAPSATAATTSTKPLPTDRVEAAAGWHHGPPPIQLLWLGGDRPAGRKPPSRTALEGDLPARIAAAVCRLLGQGILLRQGPVERPLRREDICLLVSTHDQAERLRAALERKGLASRLVSKADVFASPAALALQRLLDALADPADAGKLRLLAASPLLAWSAARIADTGPAGWSQLAGDLERLAHRLTQAGPIGVINALLDSEGLARLAVGGRMLADLQQLATLVQARLHRDQLGPAAAAEWLRRLRLDEGRLVPEEHQAHSDRADSAIAVVTVHRSKGLEFPVVVCPYLWQGPAGNSGRQLALRWQPPDGSRPRLSLHGDRRWGPGWLAACQTRQAEDAERERLAYVAMTRARHLLVLAWGPAADQASNPLQPWLLPEEPLPAAESDPAGERSDADWREAIAAACERRHGPFSLQDAPPADDPGQPPPSALPDSQGWGCGPVPDRPLDSVWGRSSYSSWTQAQHGRASDPISRDAGRDTADPAADLDPTPPPSGRAGGRRAARARVREWPERGPLADFPRGAEAGDCLHRILEQIDYTQPLDAEENRLVTERELRRAGYPEQPLAPVLEGLDRVRLTPFGAEHGPWCLAQLPRQRRLNEMGFDLSLARLRAADLAAVFAAHPGGCCDAAYAQRLGTLPVDACGFLTGSIDLVATIPEAGGTERWWVLDWKSNWLGERDAEGQPIACGPRHYQRAAMAQLMLACHYPLQAHLYLVALHRYLRWRLPGYDPQQHLGGYAYVFVRGLPGALEPDQPLESVPGLFLERPPLARVLALDALFGGER